MKRVSARGDDAEAACAQAQIDQWAQARALLDYDAQESPQSWYQVEWTLCTVAISESVLLNDGALDPAVTARDVAWMNKVALRMLGVSEGGTRAEQSPLLEGIGGDFDGGDFRG